VGGAGGKSTCEDARAKVAPTGSCYVIEAGPLSWSDAVGACAALAGDFHLATITTAAELEWVDAAIEDDVVDNERVWIGGNDNDNEGTFVWNNGEEWTDVGWLGGQPNNGNGSGENCVEIHTRKQPYTDGLNDRDCSVAHAYLCESSP
jgi:hypothetical protein